MKQRPPMLRESLTSESAQISIYQSYLARITKHYELRNAHFRIYFGFHAGLVVVVGLLLRPRLETVTSVRGLTDSDALLLGVLSAVGTLFAVSWLVVGIGDRDLQLRMNRLLARVEGRIFADPRLALYKEINRWYPPQTKPHRGVIDVLDVNLAIPVIFCLVWATVAIVSFVDFIA